jgi:hypothetical protein
MDAFGPWLESHTLMKELEVFGDSEWGVYALVRVDEKTEIRNVTMEAVKCTSEWMCRRKDWL